MSYALRTVERIGARIALMRKTISTQWDRFLSRIKREPATPHWYSGVLSYLHSVLILTWHTVRRSFPFIVLALLDIEDLYVKARLWERSWVPFHNNLPETVSVPDELLPAVLFLAVFGAAAKTFHDLRMLPASTQIDDAELTLQALQDEHFEVEGNRRSLYDVFAHVSSALSTGVLRERLADRLNTLFKVPEGKTVSRATLNKILSGLSIHDLTQVDHRTLRQPSAGIASLFQDEPYDVYFLSDFGKRVARKLTSQQRVAGTEAAEPSPVPEEHPEKCEDCLDC